jgi:hypothetical protein
MATASPRTRRTAVLLGARSRRRASL